MGEASALPSTSLSTQGLVPVTIMAEPTEAATPLPVSTASDKIEIEICATYRVRVGSGFDSRALKHVLDALRTDESGRVHSGPARPRSIHKFPSGWS